MFRQSLYRHVVGQLAKREECFLGVTPGDADSDSTNLVASSALLIAYKASSGIGLCSVVKPGKYDANRKRIPCVGVLDLTFSPFEHNRLAVSCEDGFVRVYTLPETDADIDSLQPTATMRNGDSAVKVKSLAYHPTAESVVAGCADNGRIYVHSYGDEVKTLEISVCSTKMDHLAWNEDGSLLLATAQDKKIRLIDPRQGSVVAEVDGHEGNKGQRVVWLPPSDRFISTGFNKMREQQIYLWDSKSMTKPLKTMSVGTSTGILLPFFDMDTQLLFVGGRGSSFIRFYEVVEKDPYFYEIANVNTDQQMRGLTMGHKFACDIMDCEIARLFKVTAQAIEPVRFHVPKKPLLKREFQQDIFPPTSSDEPALTASQWLQGANAARNKISPNPNSRPKTVRTARSSDASIVSTTSTSVSSSSISSSSSSSSSGAACIEPSIAAATPNEEPSSSIASSSIASSSIASSSSSSSSIASSSSSQPIQATPSLSDTSYNNDSTNRVDSIDSIPESAPASTTSPIPIPHPSLSHPRIVCNSYRSDVTTPTTPTPGTISPSPLSTSYTSILQTPMTPTPATCTPSPSCQSPTSPVVVQIVRESKFRHITGALGLRSSFFTDAQCDPSRSIASNGLQANSKFLALPWRGTGGVIAVISRNLAQKRLPHSLPVIQAHTQPINDFVFSPFDDHILATASDDCHIKLWKIEDGGVSKPTDEPFLDLSHVDSRIGSITFHTTAQNLLLASGLDFSMKLFDVEKNNKVMSIAGHTDVIYDAAFSPDGSRIASTSRDKIVRIIDPRNNTNPLEICGHSGSSASRLCWVDGSQTLASIGSSAEGRRQLCLFDIRQSASPLGLLEMETSSGVVLPFVDQDLKLLYLAAKGDASIRCIEITDTAPYLHIVSDVTFSDPQQGVAMLPKRCCDVRNVEVAAFLRVTVGNQIQPVSFTVPRARKEYFQDDVFPDTWNCQPLLTSDQWLQGENGKEKTMVSLCASGMQPLSRAPEQRKAAGKTFESTRTGKDANETVLDSMMQNITRHDDVNPCSRNEGVDEDEWSD